MILEAFGFLHMSFADIVDIIAVALIIFYAIKFIRGSAAMNIFLALIFLVVVRVFVDAFGMKMMSAFLGTFLDLGLLAVVIIFQPEIRHFLMRFGGGRLAKSSRSFFNRIMGHKEDTIGNESVNEIAEACRSMSETKTGALIVIPHGSSLDNIIETGDRIDASINRRLIMNLFFKNSPLHDGAMIISEDRIVAARCTLPITQKTDIPPSFGMRHKAAIGISEEADVVVIVVSEETGNVSFVKGGNVTHINNMNELKLSIGQSFNIKDQQAEAKNTVADIDGDNR